MTVAPGTEMAKTMEQQPFMVAFAENAGMTPEYAKKILFLTLSIAKKDGAVTEQELAGFLMVAGSLKLNPFLREIHAFVGQDGVLRPIVGIDGWMKKCNEEERFEGVEFEYGDVITMEKKAFKKGGGSYIVEVTGPEWVEATFFIKGRRGFKVREWLVECWRNTNPWNGMTYRMLRHKVYIQCARLSLNMGQIPDYDAAVDTFGPGTQVVVDLAALETGEAPGELDEGKSPNVAKTGQDNALLERMAQTDKEPAQAAPAPQEPPKEFEPPKKTGGRVSKKQKLLQKLEVYGIDAVGEAAEGVVGTRLNLEGIEKLKTDQVEAILRRIKEDGVLGKVNRSAEAQEDTGEAAMDEADDYAECEKLAAELTGLPGLTGKIYKEAIAVAVGRKPTADDFKKDVEEWGVEILTKAIAAAKEQLKPDLPAEPKKSTAPPVDEEPEPKPKPLSLPGLKSTPEEMRKYINSKIGDDLDLLIDTMAGVPFCKKAKPEDVRALALDLHNINDKGLLIELCLALEDK